VSEIEKRREIARKVFEEALAGVHDCTSCSRDRSIEVATQVTISPAVIEALDLYVAMATMCDEPGARRAAENVFTAAGFEVIR
jgi:hypothetical protein